MNEYVRIALEADPIGLVRGFAEAESAIGRFHATYQGTMTAMKTGSSFFNKLSTDLRGFGLRVGAVGSSMSLTYAGSVKAAMEFQTQIKNVQSLTKAASEEMRGDADQVLAMAQELHQDPVDLGAGLYDIASSGFAGADGLEVLRQSAIGASAGLTKAAVASKAIVAAMNAYGLGAESAADITDILFQAVNVGVLTFEQMAGAMGQWVGMAAQVGVAADEGAAAIATMTLAGIGADEAATYLSRLMETFVQPNEELKALAGTLGYATAQAMVDAKGLGGALFEVEEALEGDRTALANIFPSIQAYRGAMAILSAEGKNWARTSEAIMDKTKRSGAAYDTYKVQAQSLEMAFKKMFTTIKVMLIKIGDVFIGPVTSVVNAFTWLLNIFDLIPQPILNIASAAGALLAVLLTVSGVILSIGASAIISRIAFLALAGAFTKAGTAIAGLAMAQKFQATASAASALGGVFSMLGGKMKASGSIMKFLIGTITSGARVAKAAFLLWRGGATAFEALAFAMGIASTSGQTMSSIFQMLTKWSPALVLAGVGIALYTIVDGLDKASEAGKKAAKSFAEGIDTSNFLSMKKGLNELGLEIQNTERELADLDMSGFEQVVGSLNIADGAKEKLLAEKKGYQAELKLQERYMKEKMDKYRALATATYLSANKNRVSMGDLVYVEDDPTVLTEKEKKSAMDMAQGYATSLGHFMRDLDITQMGPQKGQTFDPLSLFFGQGGADGAKSIIDGYNQVATEIEGQMGFSIERMMYDVQRIADAQGISLDDLFETDGTGEDFARQIGDIYNEMNTLSPAAQRAKLSFLEMGEASDDAVSNIERLQKALEDTVDAALGYEDARDSLQGLVNDTYTAVQDIKEAGTLGQAMDLDSFHEDALTLRSNWRGIVQGLVDDTTAWAKSQGEVTGADIEQHLAGQIDQLRKYGREMGLSDEFVNHYIEDLKRLTEEDTIAINFQDNIPESKAKLDSYLLELLGTPANVNTAVNLFKTKGEKELREWAEETGTIDGETITTFIEVQGQKAYEDLTSYVDTLGQANNAEFINTIINLQVRGDQAAIDAFIEEKGITQEEYNAVVQLLGGPESLTMLEIIKNNAKAMGDEPYKVTVEAIDNATSTIGAIQSALVELEKYKNFRLYVTTVRREQQEADPWAPKTDPDAGSISSKPKSRRGKGNAIGSILSFADGGMPEEHIAQIAPAGAWRVWAEPETGGEAYIPLANSKRARSTMILQEVARNFGMKVVKYARGGTGRAGDSLSSRFRPDKDAEEKAKKEQDKANREAEKAAQDAVEGVSNQLNIEEFKLEMGDASPEQFVTLYRSFLGKFKPYTDEWMDLQRKIKDTQEQMKQDQMDWQDAVLGLGRISIEKHVDQLRKRAEMEQFFGTEWWNIAKEISDMMDDLAEKKFNSKSITSDQYLAYLNARLAGVEQYSEDWFELTEKIKQVNEDARAEELKRAKQRNELGEFSDSDYLNFLKQKLVATEKFSDEYMELWNEIASIEEGALKKSADLFSKFNNRMSVSSGSIINWLKKQVKMAQQFRDTMNSLAASGMYSPAILGQLEAMGPAGLGLAKGLLNAGSQGAQDIVALLGQAQALGIPTASYDRGGYLQPGLTLAYNGTGAPERVGNSEPVVVQEGPALNVEQMIVQDGVDVDSLSKKTAFAVSSRRL